MARPAFGGTAGGGGVNLFGKEWLSRRSWLRLITLALAIGTWIAVHRSLHF